MNTELSTVAAEPANGMIEVASSRQAQEVQALAIMAKRFPRDETASITRIINSCKRVTLAERAIYSYPKGGQKVTGPSIRLAEEMARNWGNLDFGIIELEQRHGESDVMAYCWDLETNCRQSKVFTVKHERHTKRGIVHLTDPRDIYELVANQGARRLRACIIGVIPGDVQDIAVQQCAKTLSGASTEPLIDRVRKMVTAFQDMGVTQSMLEARLGHKADICNEQDLVSLRSIYQSLNDGMSSREQWFETATEPPASGLGDVTKKLVAGKEEPAPAKKKRAPRKKKEVVEPSAEVPDEDVPFEPAGEEGFENEEAFILLVEAMSEVTEMSDFARLIDEFAGVVDGDVNWIRRANKAKNDRIIMMQKETM